MEHHVADTGDTEKNKTEKLSALTDAVGRQTVQL
jgi:hypothetical protein